MENQETPRKIDPIMEHFGIEIIAGDENETIIMMPISDNCRNYGGMLHGAVYYALADIAAGHHVHVDGRSHVTQNGGLSIMKPASEGNVYARANFLHRGNRTSVIRIEIFDEEGNLLAEGNYTYYCVGEREEVDLDQLSFSLDEIDL